MTFLHECKRAFVVGVFTWFSPLDVTHHAVKGLETLVRDCFPRILLFSRKLLCLQRCSYRDRRLFPAALPSQYINRSSFSPKGPAGQVCFVIGCPSFRNRPLALVEDLTLPASRCTDAHLFCFRSVLLSFLTFPAPIALFNHSITRFPRNFFGSPTSWSLVSLKALAPNAAGVSVVLVWVFGFCSIADVFPLRFVCLIVFQLLLLRTFPATCRSDF